MEVNENEAQEIAPAPEQLQDQPKPQGDELEEINIAEEERETAKPLFISKNLSSEQRIMLIHLLKEFQDIFAWTYEQMPGLDENLVTHELHIAPGSRPVKQHARVFRHEIESQIKEEINKLLKVGFIKPIHHPTWLANVVPVKKKNGTIRVCVDFRDLNKACPKDDFPLPNIDTLVDATAGHEMFSFMDGFSGYNQIKMASGDAEKTAFRTPFGNFYYTVMPFGLKNSGATYQRAMTAIFHDMMHDCMEDYVDDIVVKSKKVFDHFQDLRRVFERSRKFKLRMNPLKCAFGVSAGKFLGFVVHRKGIDVDPAKVKAIQSMPTPMNQKQLKSLLGKVSYIRRFIPALGEIIVPFQVLLKKGISFEWGEQQQEAFDKIKRILTSPATMTMPLKDQPMMLYLTSTPHSIGALLVQEVEEQERPVYYLSRCLHGSELNYSPMEKHCLALVFTTQKLRHYFLAHKLLVVTKSDPIKYLLSRPALSGRIAKWLLLLGEFDISVVQPKAIKSQALSDLLAHFPSQHEEDLHYSLPNEFHEEVCSVNMEDGEWNLYFDGSSTTSGGGVGIVLIPPSREVDSSIESLELISSQLSRNNISLEEESKREGYSLIPGLELNSLETSREPISLAFKLDFPCTNNQAEYEALILGLFTANSIGVNNLCIHGDSNLIIKQANGEFALKEQMLAPYRTLVQTLWKKFQNVKCQHSPRSTNRYADALATLASKIQIPKENESITMAVVRRTLPCTASELLQPLEYEEDEDWRLPIIDKLVKPTSAVIPDLKYFSLIEGVLYHRSANGVLARCISSREAEERLRAVHEQWCGEEGPPLHRLLQRAGYFWPTMSKDALQLQKSCSRCSEPPDVKECNFIGSAGDWRRPYIDYLKNGVLPTNHYDARQLKRRVQRFFMNGDDLFRVSFAGKSLKCISPADIHPLLEEVHGGSSGEHEGGRKLYQKLLDIGYYWPTMEADAVNHARKCYSCQIHGNAIHAPAVELHSITTPWPFHTWAFDLIGPINPPSKGYIWILAATECFTKWVEAISLKNATGPAVANFIKENIICRFGIPKRILSDNGTPFINSNVRELLALYDVDHVKSSPYYPKGNGQAEATNKTLLKILSRMVHEEPKLWCEALPVALWAYRTSKRAPTKATPFSLVYGTEAVLPAEILVPSARLALDAELNDDALRMLELEALEERRDKAKKNLSVYQRRLSRAYDKLVKRRNFEEGDLVLRAAEHIRRGAPASKFSPKWEGPYIVHEVNDSGYCKLMNPKTNAITAPINFQYIKKFHV